MEIDKSNSLYIRFPTKLNSDRELAAETVRALNDRIKNVRFPRQKSARWCLLDFESEADRDAARTEIQKQQKSRLVIRKTLIKQATGGIAEVVDKKREKTILRRVVFDDFKALAYKIRQGGHKYPPGHVTNTIIVKNIPSTVKQSEIKDMFPKGINFRFVVPKKGTPGRVKAFILLPSPWDAKKASKQRYEIGGERIYVTEHRDIGPEEKEEMKIKKPKKGGQSDRYFNMNLNE